MQTSSFNRLESLPETLNQTPEFLLSSAGQISPGFSSEPPSLSELLKPDIPETSIFVEAKPDLLLDSILLHNFTSGDDQVFGESFAKREIIREKYAGTLREIYWRQGEREFLEKSLKVELCCQKPIRFHCLNDGFLKVVHNNHCYVPGCPHCDRHKSSRKSKIVQLLMALMKDPRYLTLTLQHDADESFKEQGERLNKAVRKFRRLTDYKDHVDSGIWFQHATNKDAGWHRHPHVVIDGSYWPKEDLAEAWNSVGGGFCDIREIDEKTVGDLVHYTTRGSGILDDPDLTREYLQGTRNRRLSTQTGKLYGVKTQIEKAKAVYKANSGFKAALSALYKGLEQRGLNVSDQFKRLLIDHISHEPAAVDECPICGDQMQVISVEEFVRVCPGLPVPYKSGQLALKPP
ncbi:hypothetical protein ES702_06277 [subsurface metagenome]